MGDNLGTICVSHPATISINHKILYPCQLNLQVRLEAPALFENLAVLSWASVCFERYGENFARIRSNMRRTPV